MSNLQPPDYEPELSDIRTPTVLARRNQARLYRSSQTLQPMNEYNRIRRRALNTVGGRSSHRSSHAPWYSRPSSPDSAPKEPPNKRRRLESQAQSEMEQLPLELLFGGNQIEADVYRMRNYDSRPECQPENALQDDDLYYRSQLSHCNMLLKHKKGHAFALQKLVIRLPDDGRTCSVKAGMIFVTMDETDILRKTNYTMQHLAPDEEEEEELPSDEDEEDYGGDDFEADDDDDDYQRQLERLEELNRSRLLMSRTGRSGSSAPASGPPSSSISFTDFAEDLSSSQLPVELLQPDQVFRARNHQPNIELTFDPPISGRFILAKFFAPSKKDRVRIEFIGAYGWCGPRLFPASDPR